MVFRNGSELHNSNKSFFLSGLIFVPFCKAHNFKSLKFNVLLLEIDWSKISKMNTVKLFVTLLSKCLNS